MIRSNLVFLSRVAIKGLEEGGKSKASLPAPGKQRIARLTGGHFACACVHPLNDNSVGVSNLMARK